MRLSGILLGTILLAPLTGVVGGCGEENSRADQTRVVELKARDGVFVADGERNPTIRVEAGTRLILEFANTDPGIHHAISVPALSSERREVDSGERTRLVVRADAPGTYKYVCGHHRPLMEGELVVTPSDEQPDQGTMAARADSDSPSTSDSR
ncbi:MAG: cupredoxin domain-containing protein [Bradymonadaceae bacterium]